MFASPLPSTSAAARAELAAFLLDQNSREVEDDDDDDRDNETAKWSCDAMRKKIATFLASKEMTQTAFLKECGGIAPNSYGNFMKLKGAWNGTQNGTFWGAQRFFWEAGGTNGRQGREEDAARRAAAEGARAAWP